MDTDPSRRCPHCAASLEPDAVFCRQCHAQLEGVGKKETPHTIYIVGAVVGVFFLVLFMVLASLGPKRRGYYNEQGDWISTAGSRAGSVGRARSGGRAGGFGRGK